MTARGPRSCAAELVGDRLIGVSVPSAGAARTGPDHRRAGAMIAAWQPAEPRSLASRIPPTRTIPSYAIDVSDRERMRALLPAVEPDRTLDDWGRSERVERIFDATLVEFFYRYWFRCDVEGIENVPAEGGALLVSNHSGALPPDAAMIGKAIRDEHSEPAAALHDGRALLQGLSRASRPCCRRSAACPRTPRTSIACSTTSGSSCSSSPRGGRGPRSWSRTATACSASAAAASSRRRCAVRRSSCRSA